MNTKKFDHQLIIRERRENPYALLGQIAGRIGCTKERIRQVLSEAGEPTVALGYPVKAETIQKPCCYCGKLKTYRVKHLEWRIAHNLHDPDRFFCSKYCQGKWLGTKYGFTAHPENVRHRKLETQGVLAV